MENGRKQQLVFETISAVRQVDSKRSVPVDVVTYIANEARLVQTKVRVLLDLQPTEAIPEDDAFKHVHLIGDALLVAEAVAVECNPTGETPGGFRATNDRLRKIFLGTADEVLPPPDGQLLEKLTPLVKEKRALISALAKMFNLSICVKSALDYIRQNPSVGDRVMRTLGAVFRDGEMNHKIDLELYCRARDRRNDSPHDFSQWETWSDIARHTLPRSRLTDTRLAQVPRAYYGATEAGIHAGVIAAGGEVATYRGSEIAGGGSADSIIERMRLLAELALHFGDDQHTDLARSVHDNLFIDKRLDGKGLFKPDGGLNVQSTDPFTLDYNASGGRLLVPQKLPLLIYENGALRPATAAEVNSVVIDEDTGGITGARAQLWLHSMPVIARLLTENPDRIGTEVIQGAMKRYSITINELAAWAQKIVDQQRSDEETGQSPDADRARPKKRKKVSLAPAGKPEFAGVLVESVAHEVVKKMEEQA